MTTTALAEEELDSSFFKNSRLVQDKLREEYPDRDIHVFAGDHLLVRIDGHYISSSDNSVEGAMATVRSFIEGSEKTKSVSPFRFGKDHWSTFAYAYSVYAGRDGIPDRCRMRCNPSTHPGLSHLPNWSSSYGTRLKGYFENGDDPNYILPDHDDWDCVDDLVAADFMRLEGTGINPIFKLTPRGEKVALALMKHKADGGNFSNFELNPALMRDV